MPLWTMCVYAVSERGRNSWNVLGEFSDSDLQSRRRFNSKPANVAAGSTSEHHFWRRRQTLDMASLSVLTKWDLTVGAGQVRAQKSTVWAGSPRVACRDLPLSRSLRTKYLHINAEHEGTHMTRTMPGRAKFFAAGLILASLPMLAA